jgi:hypothetical protein
MRLVGQPQPAEPADYQRAAEELEGSLRRLPGLVALYCVGGVSAPGISDLDRVAVVDTTAAVPAVWPDLTERTRALAMHPPFLVEPAVFKDHRLISHLEPLQLVAGEDLEIASRPDPAYVESLLGAESLLLNLLRVLKYRATGRVKVRAVLCQLHTVRHGLGLAGLDRSDAAAAWALSDEVAGLRDSWFALPSHEREQWLRRLVIEALPALGAALDSLAARFPGANGRSARSLALGGAWTGITLSVNATGITTSPQARGRLAAGVVSMSPKTAEAAWRLALRHREVLMPAGLLALLGDCPAGQADMCARRARLLARHREFLARRGRGYTSIELSPPVRRA